MSGAGREQQRRKQQQIEGIGQKALDLAENTDDLERISKGLEAAKTSAEVAKASVRADRIQFWATAIAPLATVVVAFSAILFQDFQNQATLKNQAAQFLKQEQMSVKLQQEANEEAQWREALKTVSFDDPSHALTGAVEMLEFLKLPSHTDEARTIMGSLMPMIDNVEGFNDVLTELKGHTVAGNQADIIAIAQNVSSIQWSRLSQAHSPLGGPYTIPFVQKDVLAFDFATPRDKRTPAGNLNIGAYELDTVSGVLGDIWKPKSGISPQGQDLTNVVLENYDFSSCDFSKAILKHSVLANAQFRGASFEGADFEKAHLIFSVRPAPERSWLDTGVAMDGADLCDVTDFAESDWSGANWWAARCISPQLYEYLVKHFPPLKTAELEMANKSARSEPSNRSVP